MVDQHGSIATDPTTPSDEQAHRMDELHVLASTGRLDWTRPADDVLENALGCRIGWRAWSELPWYGALDALLRDPSVSDVLVNAPGHECRVVREGNWHTTGIRPHESWVVFAQHQLLMRSGMVEPDDPFAWPAPMMSGTADRRLRYAVTREPATPFGPTISVRVLPKRWRTLSDLVREDVLPAGAAELLVEALRCNASILVAGPAAVGKTTLTAALLQAIGEERRVIVIEKDLELPMLPNAVHLEVTRSHAGFADCVMFSLRQKPELIVVGEVRGAEALAMLKAAATGHPGVCTIHAHDVQGALKNLERMAIESSNDNNNLRALAEIVRGYMTSQTVSLLVAHIGRYGGRRRVGLVAEVVSQSGTGTAGDYYPLNPLYEYDARSDRIEQRHHVMGAWGIGRF